jgi:uncharacterized protein (DUF427 family)/acyl-CoA thioesterase
MNVAPYPYRARAWWGDVVVADSDSCLCVERDGEPPELWFPEEDIDRSRFREESRVSPTLVPGSTGSTGTPDTTGTPGATGTTGTPDVPASLRGHGRFDAQRVRIEVFDGRPGDDPRDVTVKRFPTWGDASHLIELLDVRPDGDLSYVSTVRSDGRRPVVEGSQMLGQAIVAAVRHVPNRRAVSVHMAFLRAADARLPLRFELQELSAGRIFTGLAVQARQGDRCCAAGTLLLDATAPEIIGHSVAAPDVAGPYESPPYDMGVTGRDIRVVDGAYTNDPDAAAGPPVLDCWVRFRDVTDDRALHAGLLAQFTGHMSIAAALRPHEGVGQAAAMDPLHGDQCDLLVPAEGGARRRLDAVSPPVDVRWGGHDSFGVPGARRTRRASRVLHGGRHGAALPRWPRPPRRTRRTRDDARRAHGSVSLSTGRGPLSSRPAGRFTASMPDQVAYIEPFRRRVRATKDGRTAIDSERVLLVHRAGRPPGYAFPAGDVDRLDSEAEADTPGYVTVAWDAADAWFEEDEEVFGHPRNPYHRVDCLRSRRRLRVEAAGLTLVDTTDTLAVYETALEPRLYVEPRLVRVDVLEPSATRTYCPYKGTASHWSARIGNEVHEDVAWSYEDPLPESAPLGHFLSFYEDRVALFTDLPVVD